MTASYHPHVEFDFARAGHNRTHTSAPLNHARLCTTTDDNIDRTLKIVWRNNLAALRVNKNNNKSITPRIRAGIGPTPPIS